MTREHKIQMVEFIEDYGLGQIEKVALFDERDETYESVVRLINRGVSDQSTVIILTREQYNNVFRSLREE